MFMDFNTYVSLVIATPKHVDLQLQSRNFFDEIGSINDRTGITQWHCDVVRECDSE